MWRCPGGHPRRHLTAAAPAHARATPDLVLLTRNGAAFGHCEIDLDNPAAGTTTALPSTILATCPELSRIVADPVSGQFAVVGIASGARPSVCVASYFKPGPTLAGVIATVATALPADSAPTKAALDPKASFALFSSPYIQNGAPYVSVGGMGLGPRLSRPTPTTCPRRASL